MRRSIRKWMYIFLIVTGFCYSFNLLSMNSIASAAEGTGVLIDEENFPDEAFRNFLLEEIDDGDGVLLRTEILRVTVMDCSGRGIANLTGIQLFSQIQTLDCSNNSLVSLDLSANTSLVSVNCSKNNLTTLNLGRQDYLQELFCEDNQLEILNLRQIQFRGFLNQYTNRVGERNDLIQYKLRPQSTIDGRCIISSTYCNLSWDEDTYVVTSAMPEKSAVSFWSGGGQLGAIFWEWDNMGEYPVGSSQLSEIYIDFASKLSQLGEPDRPHHSFDGWYLDSDCTVQFDYNSIICGSIRLYGRWIDLRRSVIFNYNGTKLIQTVDIGEKATPPDLPNEIIDNIEGWYTDPECTERYNFDDVIQDDLALYSKLVINEYTFPDEAFREYILSAFDPDGDGAMPFGEIDAVTEISCGYMGIKSLDGIEYFTSLERLECNNNELTSLDLQSNKKLCYLHCKSNKIKNNINYYYYAPIVDLDCSDNQLSWIGGFVGDKLQSLDCSQNGLWVLDVSGFPNLTRLEFNKNNLSGVPGMNNPNLLYLGCGENRFKSLDTSSSINLVELYCGHNQLTALDVSSNTNLDYLNCEGNAISTLKINSNLTHLNCSNNRLTAIEIGDAPGLEILNCMNNRLESLDLTENIELISLACGNNQLKNLSLPNNQKLIGLFCEDNALSVIDLSNCQNLISLYCSNNLITELDLSHCKKVQICSCWGNEIPVLDISCNEKLLKVYSEAVPIETDYLCYAIIDDLYGDNYELSISLTTQIDTEKKPQWSGAQMLLSSEIGVQFRIQVPENIDISGSYMTFAISDGRKSTVPIAEASDLGNGYYLFSCYINVLELADTIKATYHFGNGRSIERNYSATEYIESVKELYSDNENLITLVNALLDYGYYLQQSGWSDGKTHVAITPVKMLVADDVLAASEATVVYRFSKDLSNSGIADVKYSLVLNSKTMIGVYFKPEIGEVITTEGGTVLNISGETYYQFNTAKIGPANLGKTYEISASTSKGTGTVRVSAMSYVDNALNLGNANDEQKLAMTAFYYYFKAANEY